MVGGDGADILKGGAGNDAIESGTAEDIKKGGRGIDTLITGNGGGREFVVLGQVITSNDFAAATSDSNDKEEEEEERPTVGNVDSIDLEFESVSEWFDTI
jgi:hypothetical protein